MNSVNRYGGPSSPGPRPDDRHARHDLPEAVADRAASSACPQRCKKNDLTVFVLSDYLVFWHEDKKLNSTKKTILYPKH
jgi:hypothetical protein